MKTDLSHAINNLDNIRIFKEFFGNIKYTQLSTQLYLIKTKVNALNKPSFRVDRFDQNYIGSISMFLGLATT